MKINECNWLLPLGFDQHFSLEYILDSEELNDDYIPKLDKATLSKILDQFWNHGYINIVKVSRDGIEELKNKSESPLIDYNWNSLAFNVTIKGGLWWDKTFKPKWHRYISIDHTELESDELLGFGIKPKPSSCYYWSIFTSINRPFLLNYIHELHYYNKFPYLETWSEKIISLWKPYNWKEFSIGHKCSCLFEVWEEEPIRFKTIPKWVENIKTKWYR